MAGSTRTEQIDAPDGAGRIPAHLVLPEAGAGPGVVVLQEIFGVNDYLRSVCERLAALGYVALAPEMFWRLEPGVELAHDEEGMKRGMALGQRLDAGQAVADAAAALEHVRGLEEVRAAGGWAGALGFCLGGSLAYGVAAAAEPDTAVAYYGSGVPDQLGAAERISCPILLHFGGRDQFIPRAGIDAAAAALAPRDQVEFHIHEDGGHAFDNHHSQMFFVPAAALRAWGQTARFLARHLPA